MHSSLFRLLSISAVALPAALAKPEQIRAVQEPIFHYYLQAYPEDPSIPVMGPEATSEFFDIAGTIQSTNSSAFLNIADEESSYKTLTFADASSTDAWELEGDTIITGTASSYGRQLNFLVCQLEGQFWQVYLQTGSETPAGKTCTNFVSLHLPCLC
ncbi:hypothetical protein F5B20DRAFT_523646 [Whalleya microplaca]|nr:hypothetical protein F5B20DRAFT_523646 [Whalleya microplaca]